MFSMEEFVDALKNPKIFTEKYRGNQNNGEEVVLVITRRTRKTERFKEKVFSLNCSSELSLLHSQKIDKK